MAKRFQQQAMLPGMDADAEVAPDSELSTPVESVLAPAENELGEPTEIADETAQESHPTGESASLAGQTVYVIDANSLIFQVFHAIPEMTGRAGEPVNAVFGFTRDVLDLLQKKRPSYLFCAFDLPGPTFRHELYRDYKVHRTEMPDELRPQIPAIQRVMEALGVPILSLESFEADDVLAAVARQTEELGGECLLVTSDKDCRQLISERVKLYNIRKDQVYDAAALEADWGVRPDQVVDFQSLVGDPVDHVPGVPLIGPKIAKELLQKYGTLENLLDRAEELPKGKRRDNLIAGREQALLSRQLVRLDVNTPVAIDWRAGHVSSFVPTRVLPLCQEFGFHRIADQLRSIKLPQASTAPRPPVVEAVWQADYRTIDTPQALAELIEEMSRHMQISIDTETTSVSPTQAEIVGYSFAWKPGQAYYVPVRAPKSDRQIDPDIALAALKPLLENATIGKVGQNLKYDIIVLRNAGIEVAGVAFDTMLASYLLDAGERNHNLDELAQRYLNHTNIKISELIGTGKQQKRMDEVPVAAVTAYAAEDADVALRLMAPLEARLSEMPDVRKLLDEVELPLIDVLVEMECNGIKVDLVRLAELSGQYGERQKTLEAEIYQLAGHEFNIASLKQLQQVLFEELKLPVISKTKTGASTDADVLEELARQHPLPAKLLEYRQYAKLKNTYVDALPSMVNPRTGRVHASFQQAVAATGRLSSADPNLQNIPIRTEEGREIRSAFLPGHDGWLLLAADYSQIELRVLAHFSRDETLCQAFACDEDIHSLVASQVNGVPQSEVTREMRRQAKAVNFGVIYGQSAFGLAKNLDIEQSEAAKFIDAYFARYPGVDQFLSKTLEECQAKGYVKTILGRRRAIRGIRPDAARQASKQRNLPERTAINTVIQGSAADLIKLAMIAIHRRLRREKLAAKLLLQIHDELVFEVPPDELSYLAQLVAEEMSGVMQLIVPLKVDVKTGHNWSETEPWM